MNVAEAHADLQVEADRLTAVWFDTLPFSVASSLRGRCGSEATVLEETASWVGSTRREPAESSAAAHVTGSRRLVVVRDTALVMQDESGIHRAS